MGQWYNIIFKEETEISPIIIYADSIESALENISKNLYPTFSKSLLEAIESFHSTDNVSIDFKDFFITWDGLNFEKISGPIKGLIIKKIYETDPENYNEFFDNIIISSNLLYEYIDCPKNINNFYIINNIDKVIVYPIRNGENRNIDLNKDYKLELISETSDKNHSEIINKIDKNNNSILYDIILKELKENPLLSFIKLNFGNRNYRFLVFIYDDKIVLEIADYEFL